MQLVTSFNCLFQVGRVPRVPEDWRTDKPHLLCCLAYISPLLHEPRGSTAVGVLPPHYFVKRTLRRRAHTVLSVPHTSTLSWHGMAGQAFSKCPIQIVRRCNSRHLLSESKIYKFSLFFNKERKALLPFQR